MSFTAMAWASKQKVKTASQKLVLLMLANYADDEDKCWPSKKTLADVCCLSKAAICSNILKLEEAGFLRVEKREGTSSIIRLNTGVQIMDRGCPSNGQGVSSRKTGGVQQVDTNLSYTLSTEPITEDISYDADFAEFWSTYPKRPNNSKAAAKKKYILARKRGVPHVIIMAGVRDYAAARSKAVADGDSPTFTQMAETWLGKECWDNDYSPPADVKKEPVATDEELFDLAAEYPGHIGSYGVAQKLLADELSKGATIEALCEAARKYKLFCKGPPYEDRKIAPAMLEQWLKFKWREMDGYEFCTVGPDRIKTVRPKKANV